MLPPYCKTHRALQDSSSCPHPMYSLVFPPQYSCVIGEPVKSPMPIICRRSDRCCAGVGSCCRRAKGASAVCPPLQPVSNAQPTPQSPAAALQRLPTSPRCRHRQRHLPLPNIQLCLSRCFANTAGVSTHAAHGDDSSSNRLRSARAVQLAARLRYSSVVCARAEEEGSGKVNGTLCHTLICRVFRSSASFERRASVM